MQRFSLIIWLMISFNCYADLQVSHAIVRLLPPGLPNTSAYFEIKNTGQLPRKLIGAFTPIAEVAELHKHSVVENMMRMEKVDSIIIGAGEKVVFSAGNLHMMIFDLKQPLHKGQKVKLGLQMEDGEQITFSAIVAEPNQHSHH